MRNSNHSRDKHGQNEENPAGNNRQIRGFLSLGHAFFNQYKADSSQAKEERDADRPWIRKGVKVAAAYTAITFVIMVWGGWQIIISRDTEHRQLRAYVGVQPGDIENFGTQSQKIKIVRKNYGTTPAYDVGFSVLGQEVIQPGGIIARHGDGCNFPI